MLKGLNHITLAVRDVDAALAFYVDLLGFTGHVKWDRGAYLSVGELWLCLSLDEPDVREDYSHIAFDASEEDFPRITLCLQNAGVTCWKTNQSEGDSLYVLDPDGHKLEIHCGNLRSRLEALEKEPYAGLVWL
ncbi:fosfomycin resistance glutathione transferase [Aliamphritea hakodatensis]|uniref:fosfomycin resistance glutathione transferase n=1 Tax=Aliamphritea hakodatensis TaxID=2895352 RepID=UPI0022FD5826|nr:fosfomycin resistance glutathione transferase [Aliamphritea hakodatensis]